MTKSDLMSDIVSFENVKIKFRIPDDIHILKLYSEFFKEPLPKYKKTSVISRFYRYCSACLILEFNKKPSTEFRYTAYYIDLITRTSLWLGEDDTLINLLNKVNCSNFIVYCNKVKEVKRFKRITH